MTRVLTFLASLIAVVPVFAAEQLHWTASIESSIGSGNFAPYYMASNRHGSLTQPYNMLASAGINRPIDLSRRFSFSYGAKAFAGIASATDYQRWNGSAWTENPCRPADIWLQELYAEVKFRGVYLTAGLRERGSAMLDNRLSSGDLTFSGNSRPMPAVRAGFVDFQDIPFTQGWVQIDGAIEYAIPGDNQWVRHHANLYAGRYTTDWYYNYKRCYFRTNPRQPLTVTVGMQAAAQFGGTTRYYSNGSLRRENRAPVSLTTALKMFIPGAGDNYYEGNHLGSWDLKARWRFASGQTLSAYFQWPWEDGSGIGKLNGWDGLWGIEYRNPSPAPLTGIVVEYLDFTNHSGPMHWDPEDNPGTGIGWQATGADNYYNNYQFNGYALRGMAIGTPMLVSPIYNLNGMMQFLYNRMRAVHIAAEGCLNPSLNWRIMASWRRSQGSVFTPLPHPISDYSAMAEMAWRPSQMPQMQLTAQAAFDCGGTMLGNNFGLLVGVTFNDILTL